MTEQIHWPTVRPGDRVTVQLKDGKYWPVDRPDEVEHLSTPPEEMTVVDPSKCCDDPTADGTEICPRCINTWAIDFYIYRPGELANPSNPTLN